MFLKRGDNILFSKKELNFGKDVSLFYGIKNINGPDVYTTTGIINIYKLTPSLVLDTNDELENTFYSSYIRSIKMMNIDYEILVETNKLKLDKAFDNLFKIEYETKNGKQKKMIENYEEYFKALANNVEIYERNILIILKKLNVTEEKKFIEGLKNLSYLGIETKKVTEREEILRILHENINRRWEG